MIKVLTEIKLYIQGILTTIWIEAWTTKTQLIWNCCKHVQCRKLTGSEQAHKTIHSWRFRLGRSQVDLL